MLRNIKKEERVFEEKKNRERKEFEKYKQIENKKLSNHTFKTKEPDEIELLRKDLTRAKADKKNKEVANRHTLNKIAKELERMAQENEELKDVFQQMGGNLSKFDDSNRDTEGSLDDIKEPKDISHLK